METAWWTQSKSCFLYETLMLSELGLNTCVAVFFPDGAKTTTAKSVSRFRTNNCSCDGWLMPYAHFHLQAQSVLPHTPLQQVGQEQRLRLQLQVLPQCWTFRAKQKMGRTILTSSNHQSAIKPPSATSTFGFVW